ncbi:MAG: hypothetical protein KKA79_03205, partial [Nanoarchaeota archaeon]|nr:hypothetical protein [Nanoarchaeota archaeon]
MAKRFKRLWEDRKLFILTMIFLFIIVFSFFGTKLFLYASFLLGNDVVIKLNTDKEDLFLVREQEEDIKFESSVRTNPFCTANCKYVFRDISRDIALDSASFTLRPGLPLEKKYTIQAVQYGPGQDLYRFDIECSSVSTFFCHTNEETTTRSILVTVNYDLNDEDKFLKTNLKEQIESLVDSLQELFGEQKRFEETLSNINKSVEVDSLEAKAEIINKDIENNYDVLLSFKRLWENHKYSFLSGEINKPNNDFMKSRKDIEIFNTELINLISDYNLLIDGFISVRFDLEKIRSKTLGNNSMFSEVNGVIKDFNTKLTLA